jgi:hypothetical protein
LQLITITEYSWLMVVEYSWLVVVLAVQRRQQLLLVLVE